MYKIKAEGKEYYSDTLVYVKKAPNGCYVPCLAEEAEYVVGRTDIDDYPQGRNGRRFPACL
jgi:hypothetical protein